MTGPAYIATILGILLYFLPTGIAIIRSTQRGVSIFLVNLLFGWTILGWIVALIWAVKEKPRIWVGDLSADSLLDYYRPPF
ncbi:MAG TPA: superinfection immunity protein [Candidatus Binatia bacterium]|nr:superinfection immunity protein [Candidatus Binatia bacterium]